jgi:hypothetical protein
MIVRTASISEQIRRGKDVMRARYGAERFLAYFQAYTNTLAPRDRLARLYDEALADPEVVGLMVGTRPDALPEEVLELLADYASRTYFWLELGIQSIDDRQLLWMRRGHDHRCTEQALEQTEKRGIRVCGHFIFGLPGETREDVQRTAAFVNKTGMAGVKIHLLHVVKGSELERLHADGELPLVEQSAYVDRVCDFLERLSPEVVIHRLTGDGGRDLVAPTWGGRKSEVLASIQQELRRRNSRQGQKYSAERP